MFTFTRISHAATRKLAVAVLLLLGASGSALGQMPGGGPLGGGMSSGRPPVRPPEGFKCPPGFDGPPLRDRVDGELRGAEQVLQLTSDQKPLWLSFSDQVTRTLKDMQRVRELRPVSATGLQAPQLIDQALDVPRNRLTALEDVGDTAKRFYAVLSPEQQRVANYRLTAIVRLLAVEASASPIAPPPAMRQ